MSNLNLIAPIGQAGYGVVGWNVLKSLYERGHDIALFSKGGLEYRRQEDSSLVDTCLENSQKFDYDAPCLTIWHQFDLAMSVGTRHVAYPFFELDTFNEIEKHHLGYPDDLIVSSKWAKDVINNNIDREFITVIPPGIDRNLFNPNKVPKKKSGQNVVFLNCGKWEVRKGHDILLDLFQKAFSVDNTVELWLMPTNPFLTPKEVSDWEQMYLDSEMGRAGRIKIFPWVGDHNEVAKIMAYADVGIFPSRGEGWNLELLEMMSLGKPVIATNYSAHTEFCTEDNCSLIDIDDVEPAYDGRWFHEQGNWAQIGPNQEAQIVDVMRDVAGQLFDRDTYFVNEPGIETAKKFTWDITAEKIEDLMLTL